MFFKIESWTFQHLFDLGFRETMQISADSDKHLDNIFLQVIKVVRMSWSFVTFPKISEQRNTKNSIPAKTKVLSLKITINCTMDTLGSIMFGTFWSVWCKTALAEVGVSLPLWCLAPVLLAPGYWRVFLNLAIFS